MANESQTPSEIKSRDADHWAQPISKLSVANAPSGSIIVNVAGKQLTGPLRGFGQMWQKTYRLSLRGVNVTSVAVVKTWREDFARFWPKGNSFYGSVSQGVAPGEVAILHLNMLGRIPLISTGIYVIYADEESFAFMTPEGHPMAGLITFNAFEEGGCTLIQAQAFVRANDPIYEIGMRFGMSHMEDRFFAQLLQNVAAHFGVQAEAQTTAVLLDPQVQWKHVRNVWHNAGARTALYTLITPLRWLRNKLRSSFGRMVR